MTSLSVFAENFQSLWWILLPALAIVLISVSGLTLAIIYSQFQRQGFRFSLRTLLIAISLVATILGLAVVTAKFLI